VVEFGGPVYAPSGDRFAGWTINGWGRGSPGQPLHSVSVTLHGLQIETSIRPQPSDWTLATRAIQVPSDVTFPLSVTVSERVVHVPLGASSIELRVVDSGLAWVGVGKQMDRTIVISSHGVTAESVSLVKIDDVGDLPLERWS
jgi:hypothetical protein